MLLSKLAQRSYVAARRTNNATQVKRLRVLTSTRKQGSGFIWHRHKTPKEAAEHDPWKMDMREFEKEYRSYENGFGKDYITREDLIAGDPQYLLRQEVSKKLFRMPHAERMLRGFWYENLQSMTEAQLREMEIIIDEGEPAILSAVSVGLVTGPTSKMPDAVFKEVWNKVKKGQAFPGNEAAVEELSALRTTANASPEAVSVGEFVQFCAEYPNYQMKPNQDVAALAGPDRVVACKAMLKGADPAPADMASADGLSLAWIESVILKHGPKELVYALTREGADERTDFRQMVVIPWFPMWESTVTPNLYGDGIRDDELNQVAWDQDDPMGPRHPRTETYFDQPYQRPLQDNRTIMEDREFGQAEW